MVVSHSRYSHAYYWICSTINFDSCKRFHHTWNSTLVHIHMSDDKRMYRHMWKLCWLRYLHNHLNTRHIMSYQLILQMCRTGGYNLPQQIMDTRSPEENHGKISINSWKRGTAVTSPHALSFLLPRCPLRQHVGNFTGIQLFWICGFPVSKIFENPRHRGYLYSTLFVISSHLLLILLLNHHPWPPKTITVPVPVPCAPSPTEAVSKSRRQPQLARRRWTTMNHRLPVFWLVIHRGYNHL